MTDLAGLLHAHLQVTLIGLGHRLGLLDVLADGRRRAADDVADAAALDRRYVREWLGALAVGGVLEADAATGEFWLPAEHAVALTGSTARNLAPVADMVTRLAGRVPEVAARFADGAGTSASELARAAGPAMGDTRRHLYDESFVDGFLGAVPGLHERLRGGADVLDVGCGSGRTSALLADAFPRCRVVGLDIAPAAVARATADHGGREGLSFRQGDAADLDDDRAHDVVLAVDVVHDLPHPERTLRALRRALRDDGLLVLVDVAFPSDLPALLAARDLRDAAADAYAISVLYCLPSSLADGGSGWGAMIGRERLVDALEAAGFEGVEVHASPRPQNAVYVARPSLSDGPRA